MRSSGPPVVPRDRAPPVRLGERKTQAHAIYRELDASSRTEAVATARGVGLLDA
jgi:hypothetical protein